MARSRALTTLIGLAAGAVAAIGLTACAADAPVAPSSSSQGSGASAEPAPSGSAAGIVTVPASCEELVPAEQLAALDHLALNTPEVQSAGLPSGLRNPALAELAETNRVLGCVWENPDAPATALHTTVVLITGGDGAAAVKALTDDKVQCYGADSGTRCEFTLAAGGIDSGETHFFRDDIWIATAWSNVAPPGYTSAVVAGLWP